MAATDGTTPLNAANVVWKGGEDYHGNPALATGHLHNYGNVEAIGGIFNTVYSNVGVATLNPSVTLGSGLVYMGFYFKADPYPAALATFYHPVNYYLNVQFPLYVPVRPNTLTLYFEGTQTNISTGTASVASNVATTFNGKLCAIITLPVSTRTINGTVLARGYVMVQA